jgi:hypothetical protein
MNMSNGIPRLLVVQRGSLSHSVLNSRSIAARFYPILEYMYKNRLLEWEAILDQNITFQLMRNFDAILLNKHITTVGLKIMHLAKELGIKVIYDLDDWIFNLPDYSVTFLEEDHLQNIIEFIRGATFVTVSNEHLQKKIANVRKATILENGIDIGALNIDQSMHYESTPCKIIYSNTDGIKLINFKNDFFRALSEFLRRNENVSLEFWGDEFPEIHEIPRVILRGFMENRQYKKTLVEYGYTFAIAPLGGAEDSNSFEFNSCKTCIKYIDYGALGIPGIYSATPVYEAAVKNLNTGLIVANDYESWLGGMQRMLDDKVLRHQIRRNAYFDIKKNYGLETQATVLSKMLNN